MEDDYYEDSHGEPSFNFDCTLDNVKNRHVVEMANWMSLGMCFYVQVHCVLKSENRYRFVVVYNGELSNTNPKYGISMKCSDYSVESSRPSTCNCVQYSLSCLNNTIRSYEYRPSLDHCIVSAVRPSPFTSFVGIEVVAYYDSRFNTVYITPKPVFGCILKTRAANKAVVWDCTANGAVYRLLSLLKQTLPSRVLQQAVIIGEGSVVDSIFAASVILPRVQPTTVVAPKAAVVVIKNLEW